MYKKICITNRHIAGEHFFERIRSAASDADYIILREKDMSENEYTKLARNVKDLLNDFNARLILHTFKNTAYELNWPHIHLTFNDFNDLTSAEKASFKTIGVSVHSLKEAVFADKNSASYITASHIFATDCKKGLEPKGLDFLKEICDAVSLPVYALGGINSSNIHLCTEKGADGICMMSEYMK